jgi:4-amino-4-deoxy-L-arabinose transferase-like glycosyltransferase
LTLPKRISRTPLLLAAIAFGLYLPGFWWGVPHATGPDRVQSWGVDDGTPLQPLADVHNIITPKPDRNLGYPLMHSFVVTAACLPYIGWLWLSGQFSLAGAPTYPFGLADPVKALSTLTLFGRLVSVLMGVGIVVAVWDAARALWGHLTGVLAALLVMTLFPMFYYSRVGNPDVPMMFYAAITLAALTRSVARGLTLRGGVCLGIFVGFAVATKEQIAALFVVLPFVLWYLSWRDGQAADGWFSWRFWKTPAAVGVSAFLAFGIGSGLFFDPQFYLAHIAFGRERIQELASGQVAFAQYFPHTREGHFALARVLITYLADCMTLPGLLLSLVGVLWILRREPRFALFVLPAITYLAILFWSARVAQLRYVLPAALVLALFAARALSLAWESPWLGLRWTSAAIGIFVIGLGLLRGVDLTYSMINDSRYAAARWLAPRTPPGTRIEYFGESGELPPLSAAVQTRRSIGYFGAKHKHHVGTEAAQEILNGWRDRRPDLIILVPDHSSPPGMPYNFTCPPAVCRGLIDGKFGYRLAALFETPRLLPWVYRPDLDYPSVNPPIRIFLRNDSGDRAIDGRG